MNKVKLLPYGIANFKQIRRDNNYLVDKTMFIPVLERTANFLFLIRPRRFGKSLFLNMLHAYYDINDSKNFDQLFGGLWIADHPTDFRGQYQVLHLDFSRIGGDIEHLEENFSEYCNTRLDSFAKEYASYYDADFYDKCVSIKNFRTKFNYLDDCAKAKEYRLYLIVDEYDNFTNTILNEQGERIYWALTHASGFYRDVFKLFKGMFDRIIMLGVSPVTLDDLTSGYNIAYNISFDEDFNQMLGFSEEEVRQMIRYYRECGVLDRDENQLVAEMKPWYDNYCFAERAVDRDPKMFNPDMVLYFMNHVIKTGVSPKEMIDPNIRTDYTKMKKLIQLDKLDDNRRGIIHQIAEEGFIYATPVQSFPASDLTKKENFISLLLYYGMLTIGGTRGFRSKLTIPNANVRKQYYSYLLEEYDKIATVDVSRLNEVFDNAALDGDWRPMMEHITKAYHDTTSVRQLIEGERNLQGFMSAYLSLCPYYMLAPELELNHGYCDFFLLPDHWRFPMVQHSYILELKYLKTDATPSEAESQWQQATSQILSYAQSPSVRQMLADTRLHTIVMQFRGYDLERLEEIKL